MCADRVPAEFRASLMSAFREAASARDARVRPVERVNGERVISGRMSTHRRVNETALKRDLTTDLVALLNTIDLGSTIDLDEFEHVRNSVLDFGITDVAHLTSQEVGIDAIREDLAAVLTAFEPRLDPASLTVEREEEDDSSERVRFTVSAEMFCLPANIPIDFLAEIDVSSGKVQLMRLPSAS